MPKALTILLLLLPCIAQAADGLAISSQPSSGSVALASAGVTAPLWVDAADATVVRIAAGLLAADIERLTGTKPSVSAQVPAGVTAVFLGTLGRSAIIDDLARAGRLSTETLNGAWERYSITLVADPIPGVAKGLVIAGSDRRGTAYGAMAVSEALGITPWIWWADVAPPKRSAIHLSLDRSISDGPVVRYRGIFINDEDWGLRPWAAKTFEAEVGNFGPRTYGRICELLLRLRGNCLWPAMHPGSAAFHADPRNRAVADDYAIFMGSSHCEPMLRNNVGEWDKRARGAWDYTQNRTGVLDYWRERVATSGRFDNLYTLGMRGIHDGGMPGGRNPAEKIAIMQQVLTDQRALLTELVQPEVRRIPQIFIPYKEVLGLYKGGLQVPEDVTLIWPDDNHGFIRHFATPEERRRPGGSGVYYHASYWGSPHDYLWLCTTPPALIWEEMTKASATGSTALWMLNVGDIKPAEIATEFFLRLAWNPQTWGPSAQTVFLRDFATRTFGPALGSDIAGILENYYLAHHHVRPEFLTSVPLDRLSEEEIRERLAQVDAPARRAEALEASVPAELRDAFYELVLYPVRGASAMNRKHLLPALAVTLGDAAPDQVKQILKEARQAYDQIQADTRRYNEDLAGGKWRLMMDAAPRAKGTTVFAPPPEQVPAKAPDAATNAPTGSAGRIIVDARHWTRTRVPQGLSWQPIAGLGRSGGAITVLPPIFPVEADPTRLVTASPGLEYDLVPTRTGRVTILVQCLPTHSTGTDGHQRYAIAVDGEAPQIRDIDAEEYSPQWKSQVIRGQAIGSTTHQVKAGKVHTVRLWCVDPGMVFDRLIIADRDDVAAPLFTPAEIPRYLKSGGAKPDQAPR